MTLLLIVGGFIGTLFLYLLTVTLFPGFKIPAQPVGGSGSISTEPGPDIAEHRKDVSFEVKGDTVHAWLYLPADGSTQAPCVIMANGTGGTKDLLLENYARRYQAAGFAVLSFDYRYFGHSGGEPRQLIWIPCQLEDYAAAIDFAADLAPVDSSRLALWGTSLSGGHVIATAARDHRIACVIAQCPGVDGRAAAKVAFHQFGLKYMLRMVMNGQRDYFRGLLGLSPHKIPLVAEPGRIGLMTTPDAVAFFRKLASENFVNETCARIILRADKYRPIKYACHVRCPVLLQIYRENQSLIDVMIALRKSIAMNRRLSSAYE